MHSKTLLLFSLALGVAVSQDLEVGDYPAQCNDSCGQVATASDTCDEQNDDDQGELNCVCNTQNMDSLLPECLTCLSGFRNTEDYNEGYQDAQQLLQACGFPAPSQTGAPMSSTVFTTTRTTTDDDGDLDTDTDEVTSFFTGTATGGSASPTTNTVTTTDDSGSSTVITTTSSPSPTNNNNNDISAQSGSSSSPNAAVMTAAPLVGAAAGIMAAMLAL